MEIVKQNEAAALISPAPMKLKRKNSLSKEDLEVITALKKVAQDLDFARRAFDLSDNDILSDSFAYEILALNKRFEYYVKICKERGVVAEGYSALN